MKTLAKKAGRRAANHINSAAGLPVIGLGRNADGRWRIISTGQTFVEPDERLAIDRFLSMHGKAPAANAILLDRADATTYGSEIAKHVNGVGSGHAISQKLNLLTRLQPPGSVFAFTSVLRGLTHEYIYNALY